MCKGKTVWKILGLEIKDAWNMISKLMINNHENICLGVYWSKVSFPGWKLWWSNNVYFLADWETKHFV